MSSIAERIAALQAQQAANAMKGKSTLQEVGTLNLSHWQKLFTEDGTPYYLDKTTGLTQWEDPGFTADAAPAAAAATPVPEGVALLPLPFGWTQYIEDETDRPYYVHTSGATQWEFPTLAAGWAELTNADGKPYYYVPDRENIPTQYEWPSLTLANINAAKSRNAAAATKIQALVRGKRNRKTAKALRNAQAAATRAATKIQAIARGMKNRKTVKALKTAKAAANAAAKAAENARRGAAALKIQRTFRTRKAEKNDVANKNGARSPSEELLPILNSLGLEPEPEMLAQFDHISSGEREIILDVIQTGKKKDKDEIVRIRKRVPAGLDVSCVKGVCYYKGNELTPVYRESLRKSGILPYGLVPGEIFVPLDVLIHKHKYKPQ